jgi:hypothetical protein
MSSFFPDASGNLAVNHRAAWEAWTSQFATTLSGFGFLTHFLHETYEAMSPMDDDTPEMIAKIQARNEQLTFLRESVRFSRPGSTGVFTLSPNACRILFANPAPSIPAFGWTASSSQTHEWAADQARGLVDLDSYELQAAAKVFRPFPCSLLSPPLLCWLSPSLRGEAGRLVSKSSLVGA